MSHHIHLLARVQRMNWAFTSYFIRKRDFQKIYSWPLGSHYSVKICINAIWGLQQPFSRFFIYKKFFWCHLHFQTMHPLATSLYFLPRCHIMREHHLNCMWQPNFRCNKVYCPAQGDGLFNLTFGFFGFLPSRVHIKCCLSRQKFWKEYLGDSPSLAYFSKFLTLYNIFRNLPLKEGGPMW
jgi:hypothetical protein